MLTSNFELIVEINGKPAREYYHEGNYFIEGRKKSNFNLKLRNHSWNKVRAVISVDGLSVIDGKEAGVESEAYVIDPRSELVVEGWRVSTKAVNQFVFSSKGKSYSSQMNEDTRNVGVIGAMFFDEVKPIYYPSVFYASPPITSGVITSASTNKNSRYYTSPGVSIREVDLTQSTPFGSQTVGMNAIGMNTVSPHVNNLGTGFGDEVSSPVVTDNSVFNTNPCDIMALYYDDREGLEKRGIVVDIKKSFPNAFPKYASNDRFAKRPIK